MERLGVDDRIEIHELAARYGNAIDDRDWDLLDTVFTEDAVYVLEGFDPEPRRFDGRAAIRAMMEAQDRHPVAHHVTNVTVTLDGEQVRMFSKVIGPGPRGRVGSADYRDVLRRDDGTWRIAERHVTLRRPDAAR